MPYGRVAKFEEVREIDFSDLLPWYSLPIGSELNEYTRLFTVTNETDANVFLSFDKVIDIVRMPPSTTKMFNITANKARDDGLFGGQGLLFYGRYDKIGPTLGQITIEVLYASGGI